MAAPMAAPAALAAAVFRNVRRGIDDTDMWLLRLTGRELGARGVLAPLLTNVHPASPPPLEDHPGSLESSGRHPIAQGGWSGVNGSGGPDGPGSRVGVSETVGAVPTGGRR